MTLRQWLSLALLILIPLASQADDHSLNLTPAQQAELAKFAPGVDLTPALAKKLRAIAYDQSRSLDERISAMQKLAHFTPGEPLKRKICIWDIAGRAGPIFKAAEDQRARLLQYGVDVDMVPYTSESVVAEDLKAGVCDAALISGLRARLFNRYTGTIDAIGALPTAQHMHILLQVLANPKTAHRMVSGEYVVLGVAPAGGAYIFVDDRTIDTLANAAGKKVAVLDYDPVQAEMVSQIGATPVSSDIVSAPNKFNNGVVDVLAAPLVAYQVLELYKGMSPDGGIIDYPLAQISMQLIGRKDKFPDVVAQLVREEFYNNYDRIKQRLDEEAAKVPDHWWIKIPDHDKKEYEQMMQEARLTLRSKGYYDPDMLTLERKIRCKLDAKRAECSNPVE
ncbi:MAG: putative solute-binding protein [Alcanivorax sp.]|nr:putative solute-binding protein [Alcanivorax sp.]